MQIHVIEEGDNLYRLSQLYSIPVEALVTANEIEDPNNLVIGEALVIPIWGSYYFVKEGDTMTSISQEVGVPERDIIRANNIVNPKSLTVGTRLYIPQKPRKPIFTGAFIDPDITGEDSYEVISEVGEQLTTVDLFGYRFTPQGELLPPRLENEVINSIADTGSAPIMVLTNIVEDEFSQELMDTLFADEALEDKLIDNILSTIQQKGYKGLLIDFEYLGAENREGYNRFIKKTKEKLSPFGYTVASALAPIISDDQVGTLYEGHDYETHGEVLDYVDLMTYEWGWIYGPPRAVAPINEVKKVIDYAKTKIPADKIMMGIPLYGYDFTLPYVKGESRAKTIGNIDAVNLAKEKNAAIQFDTESMSPYFYYVDEEGKRHIVWFEDARSIQAKFDLVKEEGLRGFFYWVLGRNFPQNWLLLDDNFIAV